MYVHACVFKHRLSYIHVCCEMQVGLLRNIAAHHGFSGAMALLQLLLPPLHQDHLLGDHHFTRHYLHHHFHVGQILAARLSPNQSRLVIIIKILLLNPVYVQCNIGWAFKGLSSWWSMEIANKVTSQYCMLRRHGTVVWQTFPEMHPICGRKVSALWYWVNCLVWVS